MSHSLALDELTRAGEHLRTNQCREHLTCCSTSLLTEVGVPKCVWQWDARSLSVQHEATSWSASPRS